MARGGRVAITGSASGLGAALRARLEAAGTEVIGVDLRDQEITADLSTAAGRAVAVDAVREASGGTLSGAVACAGLGPQVSPARLIAAVNYFGALAFLDGVGPMVQRGGSAVAVASNSATMTPQDEDGLVDLLLAGHEDQALDVADQLHGAIVYGMSKLALSRAVRSRVSEWGERGVRLNAIAPGPIDTPLLQGGLDDPELGPLIEALPVPLDRRASADEIAAVAQFLLSDDAAYVHGSILFCDGGSDALVRPDAF